MPECLVFIWGPKGRRLKAYAPFGHWKTQTFIAALRYDRIEAPWVIDGPINLKLFRLYIEKVLAPTLAPGDVVILDNIGSQKAKPRALPSEPRYSPERLQDPKTGERIGSMPSAAGGAQCQP